jgi:hypothetical protein
MEKKNKIPEYVIEELIPRFSGIDSTVLASVKATNNEIIDAGHYILHKESRRYGDDLFLCFDKHQHNTYAIITLLSKPAFDNAKEHKARRMYCDTDYSPGTGNLLWGYDGNLRQIYATPKGFSDYLEIKTLNSEISIDYKHCYSFDENKLKINRGYEIRNSIVAGVIQYAILNSVKPEHLDFTIIERDGTIGKYNLPIEHVLNGTIEINPVDL